MTDKKLKSISEEKAEASARIKKADEVIKKAETEQKSNPTKSNPSPKKKKPTPVKEEPGYDKKYSTYSSRISYPATYSAPLKKLSKDMKKSIKQLYTLAVKDFLLKHNCLPSNNNNKRS
jgi:hypothetical protein